MEFKLGATLWQQPEMSAMTAKQPSQDDFKERLGIAEETPKETKHDVQEAWKDSELASLLPTRLQLELENRPTNNELIALYDWGQLAGRHLSYTPGSLEGESTLLSLLGQEAEQRSLNPSQAWIAVDNSIVIAEGNAGGRIDVPLLNSDRSPQPEPIQQKTMSFLNGMLAHRWPDRAFTVLTRGAGVEIVLRDYRLTREESDQLIGDLNRYFARSDEQLEQIWLNGQSLWQRQSTQVNLAKE